MEIEQDLPVPDVRFEYEWAIWENVSIPKGIKLDWKDTIFKISKMATFKDPFTFFKIWDQYGYSQPMNFFSRKEEGKDERTIANFYDLGRDNVKVKIEALAVFKSGLEPQWEDKVCGKGGIFIY